MDSNFYYSPTVLFRQNAMRISPNLSSTLIDKDGLFGPGIVKSNNLRSPNWMMQGSSDQDLAVLNQTCGLNRLNIKSNYWKIPDESNYLTSMDVTEWRHEPLVAISSGSEQSNLFIYLLEPMQNYLVHNTTITLPNIHSMKWVPNQDSPTIAVGNDNGYAHVVLIPEPGSKQSGEIIKRMNHSKYLKNHIAGRIDKINFLGEDLLTLYKGNLFRWDIISGKNKPISIQTIKGVKNFDVITGNNSTVALGGNFGVSLFDLREKEFKIPSSIANSYKQNLGTSQVKWSPTNEYLFAAVHNDSKVRLWDTRMQDFYGCLSTGSQERDSSVTCLEWNGSDIFTGGKDGKIVHWDLTDTSDNLLNCLVKEGIDSVVFNPQTNKIETDATQRQCGTVIPASNTNITSMVSMDCDGDHRLLLTDGSSFFGVHLKIYDAVDVRGQSDKLFYTADDIDLMVKAQKSSNDTLVDDDDEIIDVVLDEEETAPLKISRKPTVILISSAKDSHFDKMHTRANTITSIIPENMSHETLLDSGNSSPQMVLPTNSQFSDNDSMASIPTVLGGEIFHKHSDLMEFEFNFEESFAQTSAINT